MHSYRSRKLNQRKTEIKEGQRIVCTERGEDGQPEFTSLLCDFNIGGNALEYIPSFPICMTSSDHNLLYLSFVPGGRRGQKGGREGQGQEVVRT